MATLLTDEAAESPFRRSTIPIVGIRVSGSRTLLVSDIVCVQCGAVTNRLLDGKCFNRAGCLPRVRADNKWWARIWEMFI